MIGGTLVIVPSGKMDLRPHDRPPDLQFLKAAIGGGYLEAVPGWDTIGINREYFPCVAYCDEEGKMSHRQYPYNEKATRLWNEAVRGALIGPGGSLRDYLVGSIVVIYGDEEFMAAHRGDDDDEEQF